MARGREGGTLAILPSAMCSKTLSLWFAIRRLALQQYTLPREKEERMSKREGRGEKGGTDESCLGWYSSSMPASGSSASRKS
jgi:hypothetical protein